MQSESECECGFDLRLNSGIGVVGLGKVKQIFTIVIINSIANACSKSFFRIQHPSLLISQIYRADAAL